MPNRAATRSIFGCLGMEGAPIWEARRCFWGPCLLGESRAGERAVRGTGQEGGVTGKRAARTRTGPVVSGGDKIGRCGVGTREVPGGGWRCLFDGYIWEG